MPIRPHLARRWLRCLLMLLSLAALSTQASALERRVALVVGNSTYAEKPLRNPVNDAELMQRTLKDLGFDVTLLRNVDRRGLLGGLRDFEAKARNAEVALFFYAGHGTQVGGSNYLIPLQAQIRAESDVPDEAVDAASVLRRIEDAKARVGLVILDACRDNPYAGASRSSSRGLARMSVPTGSIVAYATAPGDTADDGKGTNGVYTEQLARQLSQPGLDLREVFDRTATEVERITSGKQKPREDVGLRGRFVLKPGPGVQTASLSPEPTGRPMQSDPEEETWQAAKSANTAAAFEAYLGEYPKGRYASAARIARSAAQGQATAQTAPAQTTPQRPAAANSIAAAGQIIKDCTDCPDMVVLPAGSFEMGGSWESEKPVHSVNIRSFAIGKTQVTQGQWQAVMGSNPSNFPQCGASCPVEKVSWDDVQAYIQKLNAKTGKRYRLPSEAEWEYACRAGGRHEYCGSDSVDVVGWYSANSAGTTREAASKQANAFGLYDMSGNVWHWVEDYYHDSYNGAPVDGTAWTADGEQKYRVLRGGSWFSNPAHLRSANRGRYTADIRDNGYGFRLAMTLSTP